MRIPVNTVVDLDPDEFLVGAEPEELADVICAVGKALTGLSDAEKLEVGPLLRATIKGREHQALIRALTWE